MSSSKRHNNISQYVRHSYIRNYHWYSLFYQQMHILRALREQLIPSRFPKNSFQITTRISQNSLMITPQIPKKILKNPFRFLSLQSISLISWYLIILSNSCFYYRYWLFFAVLPQWLILLISSSQPAVSAKSQPSELNYAFS